MKICTDMQSSWPKQEIKCKSSSKHAPPLSSYLSNMPPNIYQKIYQLCNCFDWIPNVKYASNTYKRCTWDIYEINDKYISKYVQRTEGFFIFSTSPLFSSFSLSQGFASLFVQQTPLKLKDTYCTAGTITKTNHPESKSANEPQVVLPRAHKINQFGLLSDRQKNITYLKYQSNWVIETQAKLKWFGIDPENWQLCQNLKISKRHSQFWHLC